MKSYRVWVLALFVASLLVGSSAMVPRSEANLGEAESYSRPVKERADLLEPAGLDASLDLQAEQSANRYAGNLSLAVPRRAHTATALNSQQVAIIGGENQKGAVTEIEVLDVRQGRIAVTGRLNVARFRHTATLLSDSRVFIAGGWDRQTQFDSTEVFDSRTNKSTPGPRLKRERAAHAATALSDGRILITGGCPDASAEIFDPGTNKITLIRPRMTISRSFHGMALLKDGNILIVGGVDATGQPLRSAEVFDTRTLTFSPTKKQMRIKRVRPVLNILDDGKVQIIGGDYDGTMEVYDPLLNVFGAPAHLGPTAEIFPTSRVLQATTRSAFIDSKMSLDTVSSGQPEKPLQHYSKSTRAALDRFQDLLERAEYSVTEVPDLNRAVVAGGTGENGEYVGSVVVMESSPACITTDKTEYLPGEHPVISGSGFEPNESITIVRQEARPGHKRSYIKAQADQFGRLSEASVSVGEFQEGVTFTVTAMGESSSRVAQTTYRDARPPAAPRPKSAKLAIPMLFRDASFEVEEGLLIWEARPKYSHFVAPPEIVPQGGLGFSHTFDFAGIVDQPCFAIPDLVCPLPDGLDLQLKSGSFLTFAGSLDGFIDEDGARLVVSEEVSGKFIVGLTAVGEFELPPIPIPGAAISFGAEIDDTGIGAEATLGIVVRIVLTVNEPGTEFITTVEFSETATVGFEADIDGLDFITEGSVSGNVGFDLVDTRGGCLKISVGPELSLFAGVNLKVCEIGLNAGANVSPFIEGCINVDLTGCPSYTAPIALGIGGFIEGGLDVCVFEVGDSLDFELARLPLVEFSGLIPETEPPVITCPSPFTAVVPPGCPLQTSVAVTYPNPTVTDNCPDPTFVCTPANGSVFPIGTTTVSCTATDIWGNTASCSFPITTFSGCLQDDSSPGNVALFNAATGEYRVCMKGVTYSGVGTLNVKGCVVTIQHNSPTRRVLIQAEFAVRKGTASVQAPAGVIKGTVTDRDITNNTCNCGAPG